MDQNQCMTDPVKLPDFILDTLRCSLCQRYLSSPPIRVLPDGNTICGLCSSNELTTRHLFMENFLKNISFLCEFRKYGCEERLGFNHVQEHVSKCIYRTVNCVHLSKEVCSWEGSAIKMLDHFTEAHPESVKEKLEFLVQIGGEIEEVFMVVKNDVAFILRYKYQSGRLSYDVQYFTSKMDRVPYKLRLSNESDLDYSSTLKGGKCLPFDFSTVIQPECLTVSNYLKILNNPDCIVVAIELAAMKSSDRLTIDYELLESLKCQGCKEYLMTPIFDSDKGPLCYNCILCDFSHYKPSNNQKLIEAIAQSNYPCRWEGCNYIDKGTNIRKHEIRCLFYRYGYSPLPKNDSHILTQFTTVFKVEEVIAHLQNHNCQYFSSDELKYEMSFSSAYDWQNFFTLKHGRVVLIQHRAPSKSVHEVSIKIDAFTPPMKNMLRWRPLRCELQFEQPKSKVKSRIFGVDVSKTFTMDSLPNCYRTDERLIVTLKLFE